MRITLSAALVLTASVLVAANLSADPRARRAQEEALRMTQPVFASGEFTGRLDQEVTLNGVTYWLSPDVQIYEIGTGMVMPGTIVGNRQISVMGTRRGDTTTITMIVLRPETEKDSSDDDGSKDVSVANPARPQ
jgi:hypothetical protein